MSRAFTSNHRTTGARRKPSGIWAATFSRPDALGWGCALETETRAELAYASAETAVADDLAERVIQPSFCEAAMLGLRKRFNVKWAVFTNCREKV